MYTQYRLPPSSQVQDTWLAFSAARANLTWDGVSALVVEVAYARGGLSLAEVTGGVEMLRTTYPASGCMYICSSTYFTRHNIKHRTGCLLLFIQQIMVLLHILM